MSAFKKPMYIVGDFNINYLACQNSTTRLKNVLSQFNLSQVVSAPTRENNLLDLIITNEPDHCKTNVSEELISDHKFTSLHILNAKKPKKYKIIQFRNMKRIDSAMLHEIVENTQFIHNNFNDIDNL